MKVPAGSPRERSQAIRTAHSSSSTPSPTLCASANHCSGPRVGWLAKRDRASWPDHLTRRQVDDRLEHDVELAVQHHRADSRALAGALLAGAVRLAHLVQQLVDQAAADHVVEDRVAARGAAERRGELVGRRVAHHVAARPGAQHRDHGVVVRHARVREHAGVGRRRQDLVESDLRPAGQAARPRAPRPAASARPARPPRSALAATPTSSNSPSESSAAAVPAAIKSWSSATSTRTGTPAMGTISPRVRRKSIPNRCDWARNRNIRPGFARLAGGFRLDIEPHVVELGAAALADGLHVGRPELLRELLQVVAEADGAQEAGRVGRRDRIGLEPGLDLREAGALEALGRLLRAGEVPGALPAARGSRRRAARRRPPSRRRGSAPRSPLPRTARPGGRRAAAPRGAARRARRGRGPSGRRRSRRRRPRARRAPARSGWPGRPWRARGRAPRARARPSRARSPRPPRGRAEAARAAAVVTRPDPQPASSTVSSPRSGSRSRTFSAHSTCGAETRS